MLHVSLNAGFKLDGVRNNRLVVYCYVVKEDFGVLLALGLGLTKY